MFGSSSSTLSITIDPWAGDTPIIYLLNSKTTISILGDKQRQFMVFHKFKMHKHPKDDEYDEQPAWAFCISNGDDEIRLTKFGLPTGLPTLEIISKKSSFYFVLDVTESQAKNMHQELFAELKKSGMSVTMTKKQRFKFMGMPFLTYEADSYTYGVKK